MKITAKELAELMDYSKSDIEQEIHKLKQEMLHMQKDYHSRKQQLIAELDAELDQCEGEVGAGFEMACILVKRFL